MKTIFSLILSLICASAHSQRMEECLNEAVEISIAYKVSKIADNECSNLNFDEFKSIEESRNSKKRFLKNAIKGLNEGESVSSALFDSLDSSSSEILLNKDNICDFIKKKSKGAASEIMSDCPEGAELFQLIIGKQRETERVSDVSLHSVCQRVDDLKKQACHDSKLVFKSSSKEDSVFLPAKIQNRSLGSKASAQ
jgi:hypothetical protein